MGENINLNQIKKEIIKINKWKDLNKKQKLFLKEIIKKNESEEKIKKIKETIEYTEKYIKCKEDELRNINKKSDFDTNIYS